MNTLDAAVDNLADAVDRLEAALRTRRTVRDMADRALADHETTHAETAADRLDGVIDRLQAALER